MAENANPTLVANKEQDQVLIPASSGKRILFLLTTITFLLSFPIIFCVVWLLYMPQGICEHVLALPKLQIGVVVGLIALFVVSNVVVFLKSRFLMLGFIIVMVPLIVILTIGLALIGAYKIETQMILGTPAWLKTMVYNDNNWKTIESCIYGTRTCQDLAVQSLSYDFSRSHLSPIESGCCIPPSVCDMEYANATFWENKFEAYDDSYDPDCGLSQSKVTKLCYSCDTCRKGFINTLRRKWYKLGVFLVTLTILLIVCHLLLFLTTMWDRHAS
ncbi:hypothetical protein L1987_31263 [Smallanthus sonchifolius]|uniref:Uncharacterized protein n=1 Tax=Smallanthus sonchifolius TaxID=185202 RepID=A0ACB9I532_9ASTR|nr:hypothetical protein L1987_31263 [Smallanthus sonchifolius]